MEIPLSGLIVFLSSFSSDELPKTFVLNKAIDFHWLFHRLLKIDFFYLLAIWCVKFCGNILKYTALFGCTELSAILCHNHTTLQVNNILYSINLIGYLYIYASTRIPLTLYVFIVMRTFIYQSVHTSRCVFVQMFLWAKYECFLKCCT